MKQTKSKLISLSIIGIPIYKNIFLETVGKIQYNSYDFIYVGFNVGISYSFGN